MNLDSAIYGADDNGMAQRISGDALTNTAGKEDIWGGRIDQSAVAKGNSPKDKTDDDVKVIGDKGDSRASTKGNHGKQD